MPWAAEILYNIYVKQNKRSMQKLGYWHQMADERHDNPPPR